MRDKSSNINKVVTTIVVTVIHDTACEGDIQLFLCVRVCWPILRASAGLM